MSRELSFRSRWASVLAVTAAGALTTVSPAQAVVGDAAADGSYASTVRIAIGDNLRACTGALVDRTWVLTAASCFSDDPAQPQALAAGAPKWKSTVAVGAKSVEVAELVPRQDRDLVMARLVAAVDGVTPLPLATTAPAAGQSLRVAGFGRTKDEWVPSKLHSGVFNLDSVSPTGIATTGTGGAAICKGDTGAPAFREVNGKVELVAVASRSWQGGCLGTPATETRTGAYSSRVDDLGPWVKDVSNRTAQVKSGLHVQIVDINGGMWDTVNGRTSGWLGKWVPIDASAMTAVDSVSIGDTVHVFAVAKGLVYTRDGKVGGDWSPWREVPGGAAGVKGITATARGNAVSLQVIGSDNAVYDSTGDYDTGRWSGWVRLGDSTVKYLSSATTPDNAVHLYSVGTDTRVYTRDKPANGDWSVWKEIPGGAIGVNGITAAARGNTVDLQIIGGIGDLFTTYGHYDRGSWDPQWQKVSDTRLRAISSSAEGNVVHFVAITESDRVYSRDADYNAGKWTEWSEIPGGAFGLKAITATTTG